MCCFHNSEQNCADPICIKTMFFFGKPKTLFFSSQFLLCDFDRSCRIFFRCVCFLHSFALLILWAFLCVQGFCCLTIYTNWVSFERHIQYLWVKTKMSLSHKKNISIHKRLLWGIFVVCVGLFTSTWPIIKFLLGYIIRLYYITNNITSSKFNLKEAILPSEGCGRNEYKNFADST